MILAAFGVAPVRSRARSTRRATASRAGRPRRSTSTPRRGSSRSSGASRRTATLVHDASEGGLAVCLAEAAIFSGSGAVLDLRDDPVELFGEVGGRAVVSCAPAAASEIETVATELRVPLRRVGEAGGGTLLGVALERLRGAWEERRD